MQQIKACGLVLLAILSITAVSGATAQAAEFHSEIEKTFIFGEQGGENVLTTTAGSIKCKKMTVDSLVAQVAEGGGGTNWTYAAWSYKPAFIECTGYGTKATVHNPPVETSQACDTVMNAKAGATTFTGTPLPAPGKPDVACEIKATITSGNCSVVVNQQTPGTPSVAFANTTFAGKGAVKETSSVAEITYTVEGEKGSICGEPGVHTDGKLEGSTVLRGYKSSTHTEAEQVGVKYE
jgi:hypothetical protein